METFLKDNDELFPPLFGIAEQFVQAAFAAVPSVWLPRVALRAQLPQFDAMVQHPNIVEDIMRVRCFVPAHAGSRPVQMLVELLRARPTAFYQSTMAEPCFQYAVAGVLLAHKEANPMIIDFLYAYVAVPRIKGDHPDARLIRLWRRCRHPAPLQH